MKNQPQEYYTPFQFKLPIEIEKIIEISDPVYTFCEVIDHIDLRQHRTKILQNSGKSGIIKI